jgi:hypothetical protein
MGELVRYTGGGVPVTIRASIHASILEPVIGAVGAAIETIAVEGIQIGSAIVIAYQNAQVQVEFYAERNRVYRTQVLPVVAKADAYVRGVSQLNNMNLDPEILASAHNDLKNRMWG